MPSFILTDTVIGTGIRADMGLDDGAVTYVAAGAVQASTNTHVVTGAAFGQRVLIDGVVATLQSPLASLQFQLAPVAMFGADAFVDIGATGVVRNAYTNFIGAVQLWEANGQLNNAGQIVGGSGVFMATSGTTTNSGRITGVGQAFSGDQSTTAAGVYLSSQVGGAFRIYNTGLIEGAVQGSGAFHAGKRFAVFTEGSNTNAVLVDNAGNLGGDVLLGISSDLITNTGTINGGVTTLGEDDAIINSGTITGNVLFGEGADNMLMRGAGVVLGRIQGDGGDDFITGGDRGEFVEGGTGFDSIQGLGGDDTLNGGSEADRIIGGTGNDGISGDNDNDTLLGGGDEDSLYGEQGSDSIGGGSGNDLLDGGTEADTLRGSEGEDEIFGGTGADALIGGTGDDNMFGGTERDSLVGGAGSDNLYGGTGNNTLFGGLGDDFLVVTGVIPDSNLLYGGGDEDTLQGGDTADSLYGGIGDDELTGGGFFDLLSGAAGDDTLTGNSGTDRLTGGAGADVFVYLSTGDSGVDDTDLIADFVSGLDVIDLSAIDASESVSRNNAFMFIGDAPFTAQGQVRYDGRKLTANVRGDTRADFEIELTSRPLLVETDLVL